MARSFLRRAGLWSPNMGSLAFAGGYPCCCDRRVSSTSSYPPPPPPPPPPPTSTSSFPSSTSTSTRRGKITGCTNCINQELNDEYQIDASGLTAPNGPANGTFFLVTGSGGSCGASYQFFSGGGIWTWSLSFTDATLLPDASGPCQIILSLNRPFAITYSWLLFSSPENSPPDSPCQMGCFDFGGAAGSDNYQGYSDGSSFHSHENDPNGTITITPL